MASLFRIQTPAWPLMAWLVAALAGIVAPALLIVLLARTPGAGPILAIGLMGAGMIGAAAAGRFWIGVVLALLAGTGLMMLAHVLEVAPVPNLPSTALALVIASVSFGARGALFARSAADKGWLIALAVVMGEAAMVLTAAAMPGALPGWLLALLPAQWASAAIQTTLTSSGAGVALSELIALAGTAAATLLVAFLWPRRWPYLVMFTTWLVLSTLVWHFPA